MVLLFYTISEVYTILGTLSILILNTYQYLAAQYLTAGKKYKSLMVDTKALVFSSIVF